VAPPSSFDTEAPWGIHGTAELPFRIPPDSGTRELRMHL
jgi:hypothetical protein